MKRSNFGYYFLIWGFFSFFNAYAQEPDSIASDKDYVYDYLLVNGKISNRFLFAGRDFGVKAPALSTDVMYLFHSGFYVNASAVKLLDSNIPNQYALSVGYIRDITEKADFQVTYTQFMVEGESSLAGMQNLGLLQAGLGLDWNVLYSTLQFQGLIHHHPDLFISSKHSRYFEFDQKISKQIIVSFEPSFLFMMGTRQFYQLAVTEQNIEENNWNKLRALNMEFAVPINFEWNSWGFEIHAKYVKPLNLAEFDESMSRLIFGASFSYTPPIRRKK